MQKRKITLIPIPNVSLNSDTGLWQRKCPKCKSIRVFSGSYNPRILAMYHQRKHPDDCQECHDVKSKNNGYRHYGRPIGSKNKKQQHQQQQRQYSSIDWNNPNPDNLTLNKTSSVIFFDASVNKPHGISRVLNFVVKEVKCSKCGYIRIRKVPIFDDDDNNMPATPLFRCWRCHQEIIAV